MREKSRAIDGYKKALDYAVTKSSPKMSAGSLINKTAGEEMRTRQRDTKGLLSMCYKNISHVKVAYQVLAIRTMRCIYLSCGH